MDQKKFFLKFSKWFKLCTKRVLYLIPIFFLTGYWEAISKSTLRRGEVEIDERHSPGTGCWMGCKITRSWSFQAASRFASMRVKSKFFNLIFWVIHVHSHMCVFAWWKCWDIFLWETLELTNTSKIKMIYFRMVQIGLAWIKLHIKRSWELEWRYFL